MLIDNQDQRFRRMEVRTVDIPDECWDLVFRFLDDSRDLESISMVCKLFLSISSQIQHSLKIFDQTVELIPNLFMRFPKLTVLDLSYFNGNLEGLLHQISQSGLDLDSLNLSHQRKLPIEGLSELSLVMKNLRVLICSNIGSLDDSDLEVMASCFPLLQEVDISFPLDSRVSDFGISKLSLMLENLQKINLSGNHLLTDQSLLALCRNCVSLEEVLFLSCFRITQLGIVSAIRFRGNLASIAFNIEKRRIHGPGLAPMPISQDLIGALKCLERLIAIDLSSSFISDELLSSVAEGCHILKKLILQGCCNFTFAGISCVLSKCQYVECLDLGKVDFLTDQCIAKLSMFLLNVTSINLSGCCQLTNSAFFTLTRNCTLLAEIRMERTYLGVKADEEKDKDPSLDLVPNPQVKSLYLGHNILLDDETLFKIASICPNLELLDLNSCSSISEEGIAEVLKKCSEIRHLNLAYTEVKLLTIDSQVSQMKALNLSGSRIGDETLSVISKWFCGLVALEIQNCSDVTTKGVREVVESCMGLRELNLKNCDLVSDEYIATLEFSKPSLRKIIKHLAGIAVDYYR
ncbi:hypothetical protein HN51_026773 [Arachis hypogaea]|uniref:F-box/LRR-repeat protein 15-like leucin rich repeat domain-containing protein n=2 Tax=Arachis TaxID=3817 RepID=A0A445BQN4_ARAHY|nr:F-box/LRR-repeat protein 2-like [Arachis hypogaea]XP_052110074.1 uncharacterized protein LOC127741487 [Arachis duranensis]QHO32984.1 F-box/LRR-repeat protein [Arachis hypogaea]RYR40931.1 hypothetical protein Ahy_A09g046674 [Arachis hypogaea]